MKKFLTFLLICSVVSPSFALPIGRFFDFFKGSKKATAQAVKPTVLKHAVENAVARSSLRVRPFQIANLPKAPVVQFDMRGGDIAVVEALPREKVYDNVFIIDSQANELKAFAPELVYQKNILFRGMMLENMAEVENLLVNGLEVDKSRSHRAEGIFTTVTPWPALLDAAPWEPHQNLPVFIRISFVPGLQHYILSRRNSDVVIFKKDISASFLLDVWVLLNVNGKLDWCKAVLKEGKLTLIPGYGKVQPIRFP